VFEKIEFSPIVYTVYTILYKINGLQCTLTSSCKLLKSLVIFLYNNFNRLAVGLTPPDKSLISLEKIKSSLFSMT
jgi:hypothetical protein